MKTPKKPAEKTPAQYPSKETRDTLIGSAVHDCYPPHKEEAPKPSPEKHEPKGLRDIIGDMVMKQLREAAAQMTFDEDHRKPKRAIPTKLECVADTLDRVLDKLHEPPGDVPTRNALIADVKAAAEAKAAARDAKAHANHAPKPPRAR